MFFYLFLKRQIFEVCFLFSWQTQTKAATLRLYRCRQSQENIHIKQLAKMRNKKEDNVLCCRGSKISDTAIVKGNIPAVSN